MARLDLGDVFLDVSVLLKDHKLFTWHVSAPRKSRPEERIPRPGTYSGNARKDLIMDLKADESVVIQPGNWTDEMNNPVPAPEGVAATWTLSEGGDAFVALTDNGDGSATVAGVGPLGSAVAHGSVTFNGRNATGDLLVNVIAGDAERFEVVAGTPFETTPDA